MLSSNQVDSIIDQISNNVLTKKLVDDLVSYFKQGAMTSEKEKQIERLWSLALHRNTLDDPRIKELNARVIKLLDVLIKRILNEVELSEKAQLSSFDNAMDLEEQKAILERYLLKNPRLLIYSMGKSIETRDFKLKDEIENIILKRGKSEIDDKYLITSLVSVDRIVKTNILDTKKRYNKNLPKNLFRLEDFPRNQRVSDRDFDC